MKRLLLAAALLAAVVTTGCEDDPILSPQTTQRSGGSYGRIDVAPGDSSSAGQARKAITNPEVY